MGSTTYSTGIYNCTISTQDDRAIFSFNRYGGPRHVVTIPRMDMSDSELAAIRFEVLDAFISDSPPESGARHDAWIFGRLMLWRQYDGPRFKVPRLILGKWYIGGGYAYRGVSIHVLGKGTEK